MAGIVLDAARPFRRLLKELEAHDDADALLSIANPHPLLLPPQSTACTLASVFEATAAAHPDAIALEVASDIHGDGTAKTAAVLTYAELNSAANRLARALVRRGAEPDGLVAVCAEKSVLCYVAILAAVKAGAGYLPLAAETPPERVRQILRSASVQLLLSTADVVRGLGAVTGVDTVDFDALALELDLFGGGGGNDGANLGIGVPSTTLAYAVFTSGSTGVPKGVLVEHVQAVGNLDVLARLYPAAVGKRMLQFCSIAFDVSV